jgi:hypothetical protein
MIEAEDLFSQRGQLLETITAASDEIKAIDARLEFLRSIEFKEDIGCSDSYEAWPPSGTGMEIDDVVKGAKKVGS